MAAENFNEIDSFLCYPYNKRLSPRWWSGHSTMCFLYWHFHRSPTVSQQFERESFLPQLWGLGFWCLGLGERPIWYTTHGFLLALLWHILSIYNRLVAVSNGEFSTPGWLSLTYDFWGCAFQTLQKTGARKSVWWMRIWLSITFSKVIAFYFVIYHCWHVFY